MIAMARLGTKEEALIQAFALSTDLLPHVWIEDEAGVIVVDRVPVLPLGLAHSRPANPV